MQLIGRSGCLFLALSAALVVANGGPAPARTPYDGPWAVMIITESGTCDPAYRYAVLISDGKVAYDANESSGLFNIAGRVDARGQVNVSIRRGGQHADGSGRLSDNTGAGTWTGNSSSDACAGRWEAKRN
jgi:hypothetical protein